jgi:hypothetical protein
MQTGLEWEDCFDTLRHLGSGAFAFAFTVIAQPSPRSVTRALSRAEGCLEGAAQVWQTGQK